MKIKLSMVAASAMLLVSSVTFAQSDATSQEGPSGFNFATTEGGRVTVNEAVDIAYGANGKFNYLRNQSTAVSCNNNTFGSDPIRGIRKACFIKPVKINNGPAGYQFSANEGEEVEVEGTVDIAYGANNTFRYLRKQTKNTRCNNNTFGGDPAKNIKKSCYIKAVSRNVVDQCNTTNQCQASYGNNANDCANSKSNRSVCMCGSKRCDGENTGSNNSSNSNNSNSNSSTNEGGNTTKQLPSSCSNIKNNIPKDIRLHNITKSQIRRAQFSSVKKWYTEKNNVQRFQLHDGDQNQRTRILRPRIEAHEGSSAWRANGKREWHEFSANYYLSDWDEGQVYAIFQIKTTDATNYIIQGIIDKDGALHIARQGLPGKGRIKVADNVYRKPFHFRVRSNGYKFEVYLDCRLVLAEDHPNPRLENNKTRYGWRWGLYRQETRKDRQIGTTTLHVTGVKFN